jgi:hypothetical protein
MNASKIPLDLIITNTAEEVEESQEHIVRSIVFTLGRGTTIHGSALKG